MSKKRILLVGEHPYGISGNSHMMQAIIDQIDYDRYSVLCFSETQPVLPHDIFASPKAQIVTPTDPQDNFGARRLNELIDRTGFDILLSVGIDLWHHQQIFNNIVELRRRKKFIWGAIFPYDLVQVRTDWLQWIKLLDVPCVYSEYGYNLLKDLVPNLTFYKPPILNHQYYAPVPEEERKRLKLKHFSGEDRGKFVFGFVGNNQVRKDPQRAIKAFFEVMKDHPDICLYLHTNVYHGVFNIPQYIEDCGAQRGDVLIKNQSLVYTEPLMGEVYNAIDCLLNTSLQEGLSWTLLNAMLTKRPIVAAYNTAQKELLDGECGFPVECNEIAYVPVVCGGGVTHVETRACSFPDLVDKMKRVVGDSYSRNKVVENAYVKAKKRVEETDNVNDLLDKMTSKEEPFFIKRARNAVLFMQHSAAGDIFMTTRCLPGLKKRHEGLPLVYMTQNKYHDILEGNPHIDQILDWDENIRDQCLVVYNPHGDRILPGHWGRNCNSILSDFYWKILNVEPSDFFIQAVEPPEDIESKIDTIRPILIVHTTGGDPHFRTYKYMKDVCAEFTSFQTIQVGGSQDFPAGAELDLRGRLSFRQTAWVMSKAKLAVTVDSFISHLAGAFGVSQVCLFGSGNYVVVQPNQVKGTLICLSPDYIRHCPGLGPCSASIRECPVPCTSRHDPNTIIDGLYKIMEKENLYYKIGRTS